MGWAANTGNVRKPFHKHFFDFVIVPTCPMETGIVSMAAPYKRQCLAFDASYRFFAPQLVPGSALNPILGGMVVPMYAASPFVMPPPPPLAPAPVGIDLMVAAAAAAATAAATNNTGPLPSIPTLTQAAQPEKRHACRHCDYRTAQRAVLRVHERTHTGETPYHCKWCTYAAKQLSSVIRHERLHTGVKPYGCRYCEYRACQRSHVRLHEASKHTGDKPFRCPFPGCDFRGVQPSAVRRHQRVHAGGRDRDTPASEASVAEMLTTPVQE